MRILYVVPAYKPAWRIGGPVVSVSAAAEMLVRRGHEVIVLTTNANVDEDLDVPAGRPVDVDGVQVWYFQREEPLRRFAPLLSYVSKSMGFTYAPAMSAALTRIVPTVDLVNTHMPFVYPTYAGAHAAFAAKKPLFYHQRGNFDRARLRFRAIKKKIYISLVEKPIMKRATTLIALAEAERASFRALGVATRCRVVPNGIDIPEEREGVAERVERQFGIPRTSQVVLFLGRLHPIKGAAKLVEAYTRIAPTHPGSVLVMAGPDEWNLEEEWRRHVTSFGLDTAVRFPGMLTGSAKEDMLARADLFVLPSIGEGFSMAVLEALANRTAVLITPGCNFPEVESAGAGVVVGGDVSEIAAQLSRLLNEPVELRRMGEHGRKLVRDRYSWSAVADKLVDVYAEGVERAHWEMHRA